VRDLFGVCLCSFVLSVCVVCVRVCVCEMFCVCECGVCVSVCIVCVVFVMWCV